jgi:hypothetical protein
MLATRGLRGTKKIGRMNDKEDQGGMLGFEYKELVFTSLCSPLSLSFYSFNNSL